MQCVAGGTDLKNARYRANVVPVVVSLLLVTGCGGTSERGQSDSDAASGAIQLEAWAHAGREAERLVIQELIDRFNARNSGIHVTLTFLPEGSYNSQVQSAALAGELPDLLEFDGPLLYSYVWQGHLRALDDLLSTATQDRLLPSIVEQGTYDGALYSVGMFDSGLGLYGRRSRLEAIGARIPQSADDAWSVDEASAILTRLADRDEDGAVLDLKLNYRGEWYTYAFSPVIQSAGADLVDRTDHQSSSGTLNAPAAVAALQELQRWIRDGRVDPNLDDAAFVDGRVALSWVGHWEYPRYADAHGDDLVLLPLPDFGQGSRTGQGSWSWGITRRCAHPESAARVLGFLLEDDNVLALADANGAVPGTSGAVARSTLYGTGGPLDLFAAQLNGGTAIPRPRTAAYPFITSVFQQAFDDLRNGGDVQTILNDAAAAIDRDIRDNRGYRMR